jgi:hypothetical protein
MRTQLEGALCEEESEPASDAEFAGILNWLLSLQNYEQYISVVCRLPILRHFVTVPEQTKTMKLLQHFEYI